MEQNKTMIEIMRERILAFLEANGADEELLNKVRKEENTETAQ